MQKNEEIEEEKLRIELLQSYLLVMRVDKLREIHFRSKFDPFYSDTPMQHKEIPMHEPTVFCKVVARKKNRDLC